MKMITNGLYRSVAVLCVSTLSSTLFAQDEVSMFDGKSLAGWQVSDADKGYWRVEDGVLIGDSNGKKMPKNTYLWSEKQYDHFELRCKFRLTGDPKTGLINSGIQFRTAND